jgi:hypothetical protein
VKTCWRRHSAQFSTLGPRVPDLTNWIPKALETETWDACGGFFNRRIFLAAEGLHPACRPPSRPITSAGVRATIAEMGAPTMKEMGTVMKNAMAKFNAAGMRVDGKVVSEMVKRELAGK